MKRLIVILTLLSTLPLAAQDYHGRRERLASKLGSGVLILFASTEEEGQNATHGFRQDNDFYYLSGWSEPGAALVIAPATDKRAYTEILFLPAQNVSQERWTGPKLTATSSEATRATGFDRVDVLDHMRDELVRILPSPAATVYTDLAEQGTTASTIPIEWLRRANAFPNYVTFTDSSELIAELRLIKDSGELSLLRKATDATIAAHRAAMRAVRPGSSENEIAGLIEYEFRRNGCESPAFSSIVGSGLNATVLHYSANNGTMRDGDVVVIDIGAECGMYASDVTRTLPVNGRFTPRQREIYNIVLGAQQAAVNAFKAGVSTAGRAGENSLYRVAMDYINTHGKDSRGGTLGQYFIHGLSHYVGLEVHDAGNNTVPLKPGAVFTIEPGIYIPEERIGVRIEDIYAVRQDGTLECLSCAVPKTAEDVEAAMSRR